jgi:hypothetical protein
LAWIVAMGFAAVGFASVETAYARQVKVNVCHMTGNGAYHLITIAEPALQAHINHGDSRPGDIVPGSGNRFSFADDCTFIPGCPCVVDLPSGWLADRGISGIGFDQCPDGTIAERTFASWSDGSVSLGFSETEQCDGPTLFSCSAGGNTRAISEAQYDVCRTTTSTP